MARSRSTRLFAVREPLVHRSWCAPLILSLAWLQLLPLFAADAAPSGSPPPSPPEFATQFFEAHCLECHSGDRPAAELNIGALLKSGIAPQATQWEHVSRKLSTRQMPPLDRPRPDEKSFDAVNDWLTSQLDAGGSASRNPGRTATFRRLTRTEYQHAIRDLLALDIDAKTLLPDDESSHGFDNITVSDLSPTLVRRYVAAAETISRLAVGGAASFPASATYRARPDVTQDRHIAGLPLGTRGGLQIAHQFPQNGTYEIRLLLMRDRDEHVEGLKESHELEMLVDREAVAAYTIAPPPRGTSDESVDSNLTARLDLQAGRHDVTVTFRQNSGSLLETRRQPLEVHYNFYRHPRLGPAVYQVTINGPFDPQGPGDTPSRRRIFVCRPTSTNDYESCARRILQNLMRRAYRRQIMEEDYDHPLEFFRAASAGGDFDAGIEGALAAVLVSPSFLFRVERDPVLALPPHSAYGIGQFDLASRLSFFLWSSIPDDELLDLAERSELSSPEVMDQQVRRMLADERSRALVTNFADQWLHLRNLESFTPDARLFPDFDDNLRQAFREETERLFDRILREDRSVLELLKPGQVSLNERLAKYYGIPHVYGSRFRNVPVDDRSHRGGLLRQGSVLTVTSYATRTSPVLRGKWILENLIGTPPPPPPPDVPTLEDNTVSVRLPLRERLAAHRANAACANCHDMIDPVGFSLENFDAVGRWRHLDAGQPVDASGGLPDGSRFVGPDGLEQALLNRPELFVRTLTEKLMTFALGRGLETSDAPAVREVVRHVQSHDHEFSAMILGIVHSPPFQMRTTP